MYEPFFRKHRTEILLQHSDLLLHLRDPIRWPINLDEHLAGLDEQRKAFAMELIDHRYKDGDGFEVLSSALEVSTLKVNQEIAEMEAL